MQVFVRHLRSASLCTRGSREWFKANNLDWNVFLVEGISEELLLATDDPLARRAVDAAHREAERG